MKAGEQTRARQVRLVAKEKGNQKSKKTLKQSLFKNAKLKPVCDLPWKIQGGTGRVWEGLNTAGPWWADEKQVRNQRNSGWRISPATSSLNREGKQSEGQGNTRKTKENRPSHHIITARTPAPPVAPLRYVSRRWRDEMSTL